jgi:UDP-3-O-[3-hydroxymyristoyl] glucosamine N-acyltransferase
MQGKSKNIYRLSFIAQFLQGTLSGADCDISVLTDIDGDEPQSIAVVDGTYNQERYASLKLSAIVVSEKNRNIKVDQSIIMVKNTKIALKKLIDLFYPEEVQVNNVGNMSLVDPSAILSSQVYIGNFTTIGKNTKIGKNTCIGNNVNIGENVSIGENVKIYSSAIIFDNTVIGNNVIIYQASVIGSEGFGYIGTESGHLKIRQVGNVIIEDNVEIGANTCIDRATIRSTIIGKGTKIDNLVQVGHNTKIGENCIIVSEAGIAGSCKIGDNVLIGGQVGIADHSFIPSSTVLAAKTGVIGSLKKKGVYAGYPAQEHMVWLKNMSALKELNDMKRRFDLLMDGLKK